MTSDLLEYLEHLLHLLVLDTPQDIKFALEDELRALIANVWGLKLVPAPLLLGEGGLDTVGELADAIDDTAAQLNQYEPKGICPGLDLHYDWVELDHLVVADPNAHILIHVERCKSSVELGILVALVCSDHILTSWLGDTGSVAGSWGHR